MSTSRLLGFAGGCTRVVVVVGGVGGATAFCRATAAVESVAGPRVVVADHAVNRLIKYTRKIILKKSRKTVFSQVFCHIILCSYSNIILALVVK